ALAALVVGRHLGDDLPGLAAVGRGVDALEAAAGAGGGGEDDDAVADAVGLEGDDLDVAVGAAAVGGGRELPRRRGRAGAGRVLVGALGGLLRVADQPARVRARLHRLHVLEAEDGRRRGPLRVGAEGSVQHVHDLGARYQAGAQVAVGVGGNVHALDQ